MGRTTLQYDRKVALAVLEYLYNKQNITPNQSTANIVLALPELMEAQGEKVLFAIKPPFLPESYIKTMLTFLCKKGLIAETETKGRGPVISSNIKLYSITAEGETAYGNDLRSFADEDFKQRTQLSREP